MDMVARREGVSDFGLYADGFRIGRLADCEVAYVFEADDDELAEAVNDRFEGDMSLAELLAEVRVAYEAFREAVRAMHAAECYAEDAWLRHAERYDPEAQADLALHDFLHPDGYGVGA